MRHALMLSVLLAAAAPASAATRNFTAAGFEGVATSGAFDVVVTTGKAASVRAEGAADDLDKLDIRVEDRVLKLGTKRQTWGWNKMGKVTVYVTAPSLSSVALSGSGGLSVDRIKGNAAALKLSGSGDIKVGNVEAQSLAVALSGSGDIAAPAGSCRSATVSIAGSGDVAMAGLRCETLTARVAGSGNIDGFATGSGSVSIAGSGDVRIAGGAKCSVKSVGSGKVQCG